MRCLRRAALALALFTSAACGEKPEPRFAPGAIRAVRLGFDLLAARSPELSNVPEVAVAEDQGDLSSLWSRYRLDGDAPDVDFDERIVVVFTQDYACGAGKLTGLTLTSAGELVPELHYSGEACYLALIGCPRLAVYVVSLPRANFPVGTYVLRTGREEEPTFSVHEGAVARSSQAPLLPPPPTQTGSAGAHPRRARVLFASGEESIGVWVRNDAVWLNDPRHEHERFEEDRAKLVCDGTACAPVLVLTSCGAPECPVSGLLAIAERAIGAQRPLPREARAWEQSMRELRADPALADELPDALTYPESRPKPERSTGWMAYPFNHVNFEAAPSVEGTRVFGDGAWLIGPSLRLGYRGVEASTDTTTSGLIRHAVAGDAWGIDLRLRWQREVGDLPHPRTLFGGGLALAVDNALGNSNNESRLRTTSLLGLLLPEVGLERFGDEPVHFYTSHAIPLYVLVTREFALETRPAFKLLYAAGEDDAPATFLSLSFGLVWRFPHTRCP